MAKKKKSLGCLFWVALVLIVVVIFLFNQKNIREVLRKTGFPELFGKEEDEQPVVSITTDEQSSEPTPEEHPMEIVIETEKDMSTEDTKPDEMLQDEEPEQIPEEDVNPPSEKPHVRKAKIYFIQVKEDGEITMAPVTRSVRFNDSPLRETLLELLKGQTRLEMEQGYQSLIPPKTELLNIYIKGDTAFIDFSESFRFNSLGQAGLEAQLKQVVYTTLEFSNILNVQILIEGQIRRYLGPEGILIGEPISRDTFSQ